MSKPVAVIIGDIHFRPDTLELASEALRHALATAHQLQVPIILNGDTTDTKAILRAEVVNTLIHLLGDGPLSREQIFVNVGNHDLLNEKGDDHALHFLEPYANVISYPTHLTGVDAYVIPYQSDKEALLEILKQAKDRGYSRLIVHQGLQTANMGHYVQDKTSLPPEAFADFRAIASHYHLAQSIRCGRPRKGAVGLFSYIGNPYTQSFGEAYTPSEKLSSISKGYVVLHHDGLLSPVPVLLRKHVIIDANLGDEIDTIDIRKGDKIWVKLRGPRQELDAIDKAAFGEKLFGSTEYKLDKIPTDEASLPEEAAQDKSEAELLDQLIDSTGDDAESKEYLKSLWRQVASQ